MSVVSVLLKGYEKTDGLIGGFPHGRVDFPLMGKRVREKALSRIILSILR